MSREMDFNDILAKAIKDFNDREKYEKENTVIVTRCKYCKHFEDYGNITHGDCTREFDWYHVECDDYCSKAERKEQTDETD